MMGLEEIIHESLEKLQKLGLDALDAEECAYRRCAPSESRGGHVAFPLPGLSPHPLKVDSEQIIGRLLGELHFYLGTEQTALGMYSFDVEMEEIKQMYTGFLEPHFQISIPVYRRVLGNNSHLPGRIL